MDTSKIISLLGDKSDYYLLVSGKSLTESKIQG